jgi:PAS domain S-box-containing protein
VQEEPLRSDIVVPLLVGNKLIGTLNVGSYRGDAFTERDLELLENCGKFASLAIEHTTLRLEAQALGERYRSLQENANDMIMVIDKNTGGLTDVNRKCERVLGYTKQDLVKKSYFDLFAPEDQYPARRDFINILSQKTMTIVDRRMIDRDGNIIYVDINANLVNIGNDTFIQVIVHNVSQRRMLEQQIIHQNKHLQAMNKKLMQVDQMKTEFLANISHELRTPLSIIIAYAESLKDPGMSEEDRGQFAKVIADNGVHLLNLINNLLDLSKLEISGQMLNMSLSHIHDVIKSIWADVEAKAKEKEINISFNPSRDVPVTYFDNNQIIRVIQCLIGNALKFTDTGGYVEVNTFRKNKEVMIEVVDTGTGIHADKLDSIFDTFRQGDGSSSRKWGGLGIGLALAKHIIELHKGKLLVDSEFGIGSTFTVALPIDTEEVFLERTQEGITDTTVDSPVD